MLIMKIKHFRAYYIEGWRGNPEGIKEGSKYKTCSFKIVNII